MLEDLRDQRTVVVTTYRRSGEGVPTPVNIAVDDGHGYMRTWSTSGKAKRLRRDHRVQIAPSTWRGKPTGPAIEASARLLEGDEARTAARLLNDKYPTLQGRLVPWAHRLRKYQTVHYELIAV
jgi:PPOX class probable F420-dependent enzyme